MSDRTELTEQVRELGGRLTSVVSDIHGLVINQCLTTETILLDAGGRGVRDWTVPFGAVAIHNAGAEALTVVNGTPTENAPVSGIGVVIVPSGAAITANIAGRTLSFYGAPGAGVILSAFTRPQPPAFSQLGVLVLNP
jgi:hypothetical protein